MDAELHVLAAQRWIDMGTTSATNPLLQFLEAKLFAQLGISCEYMECECLTHPTRLMLPTFCRPQWRRDRVLEAFASLLPDRRVDRYFKPTITVAGHLVFPKVLPGNVEAADLVLVDQFDLGVEFNALVERCRRAAALFMVRAFEQACCPGCEPARSQILRADPAAFAGQLWASF